MKKTDIINIFTMLILLATSFQGAVTLMQPVTPADALSYKTMGIIALAVIGVFTAWKQLLSEEIANRGVKWTIFFAAIALLGGLNDLFGPAGLQIDATWGKWIGFSIGFVLNFLNMASKVLWPTPETKSKI